MVDKLIERKQREMNPTKGDTKVSAEHFIKQAGIKVIKK